VKNMDQLGNYFSTQEWTVQFEHAYACKMKIVGSCLTVESDYRSAVIRHEKEETTQEQYLYELRLLVLRLEAIIARDKNHRPYVEQPQAAPVEAIAEQPVVAKPKKPRTPKPPQKGVPIGLQPINRKDRRKVAKAA